jgi:uncharacterized protein (DUF58 family)
VSPRVVDLLYRPRTPAEPGPGPLPTANLDALNLAISRRLDGLLAGDYRAPFAGIGTEIHQVRTYRPGDDVRRIDWAVTARTGETHVRVELAERTLVTWLVADLSASMAFGTTDRRKTDVAEGAAMAIGYVASRHGNRLGVVAFGPNEPRARRPHQGRVGLLLALRALREQPGGAGGLADSLKLVDGLAVRRSLVVVISDFRGPVDWQGRLLRLASRHPLLAIEVRDPREQELADVGELRLEDPETGRQMRVDTRNPLLRERFAAAAAAERQQLVARLGAAGVAHVVLSTEGDWLSTLAAFLRRSGRA